MLAVDAMYKGVRARVRGLEPYEFRIDTDPMSLRSIVRRVTAGLRGRPLTEHERDGVRAEQQRSIRRARKHFSSRV